MWKEFGLALGFVEKYFLDELRRSIPNLSYAWSGKTEEDTNRGSIGI
jgi:hypothetical protein